VFLFALGDLHERVDDRAEDREAFVNVARFFESGASCAGLLLPFGASEVDEVELGRLEVRDAEQVRAFAFDGHGEDAVRAGRLCVHVGRADVSVARAFAEDVDGLLGVRGGFFGDVFDEDASLEVFADLEVSD